MSAESERSTGYVVPSYRAADDAPWYHFLHGNVPGHQIDFMYRAEVPQGLLTRQHFSHLSRLMKYIEPQPSASYAFAIGNLSRDDTQHEPGHGGVALIFGMRIQGATDHAGRQDPPFAHGIAAIDRDLTRQELLAAAGVFHRHVLAAAQSADWYRSYVRCAAGGTGNVAEVFEGYIRSFSDMPSPDPSSLDLRWTVGTSTPPRRVIIVHDDDAPFGQIAACAAKIAAVLYPSDIRWSAISNGREADLPNGVTVRFVAERNLTAADTELGAHPLDSVPEDEEDLARTLFGASSTATATAKPRNRGWRERYSAMPDPHPSADGSGGDGQRSSWEGRAPAGKPAAATTAAGGRPNEFDAAATRVWDRASPGGDARSEDEIEVDPSGFDPSAATLTAAMMPIPTREPLPFVPASTRPPPNLAIEPEEALASNGPSGASLEEPRSRRETTVISAEDARKAVEAAMLPFKAPPQQQQAAPPQRAATPRPSPVETWEPAPNFRRPREVPIWRWIAIIAALASAIVAALYLLFADAPVPERPAPGTTTAPSAASAAPIATPATSAPGTSAPTISEVPAVPTATASSDASPTKPPTPRSSAPKVPVPPSKTAIDPFKGPLTEPLDSHRK